MKARAKLLGLGLRSGLISMACAPFPPENPLPPDFRLALSLEIPDRVRTEVRISRAGPDHPWRLRIRRSDRIGNWPILHAATFEAELPEGAMRTLCQDIEASGFFFLPPLLPSARPASRIRVDLRRWNRRHRVLAEGRTLPAFTRLLEALDRLLPVALSPWPSWAEPMKGGGRPGLVNHLERSLAFHRRWLLEEPGRRDLTLDLVALLVELGRPEEAARELQTIRGDPVLGGLVPALEAWLKGR